jgi:ubiquinone/menaquinone biosynthesis C-methylase UbiE
VCEKFLAICESRSLNAIQSSVIAIPFPDETFDHVICIAGIHHIRTAKECQVAIQKLLRILKQVDTALLYMWAFEQAMTSKQKLDSQDEMVPFQNTLR